MTPEITKIKIPQIIFLLKTFLQGIQSKELISNFCGFFKDVFLGTYKYKQDFEICITKVNILCYYLDVCQLKLFSEVSMNFLKKDCRSLQKLKDKISFYREYFRLKTRFKLIFGGTKFQLSKVNKPKSNAQHSLACISIKLDEIICNKILFSQRN